MEEKGTMKKIRLLKPKKGRLVCSLILIIAILPIASAVQTPYVNVTRNTKATTATPEMEITIYGSHYMKENKPFGHTNGLYAEFIYHGEGSIVINASMKIHTRTTHPMSFEYIIAENFELPAEATGQTALSQLNFGIGFFSFTIIIDGCGQFAGKHFEKTAHGICIRYNAFIVSQQ